MSNGRVTSTVSDNSIDIISTINNPNLNCYCATVDNSGVSDIDTQTLEYWNGASWVTYNESEPICDSGVIFRLTQDYSGCCPSVIITADTNNLCPDPCDLNLSMTGITSTTDTTVILTWDDVANNAVYTLTITVDGMPNIIVTQDTTYTYSASTYGFGAHTIELSFTICEQICTCTDQINILIPVPDDCEDGLNLDINCLVDGCFIVSAATSAPYINSVVEVYDYNVDVWVSGATSVSGCVDCEIQIDPTNPLLPLNRITFEENLNIYFDVTTGVTNGVHTFEFATTGSTLIPIDIVNRITDIISVRDCYDGIGFNINNWPAGGPDAFLYMFETSQFEFDITQSGFTITGYDDSFTGYTPTHCWTDTGNIFNYNLSETFLNTPPISEVINDLFITLVYGVQDNVRFRIRNTYTECYEGELEREYCITDIIDCNEFTILTGDTCPSPTISADTSIDCNTIQFIVTDINIIRYREVGTTGWTPQIITDGSVIVSGLTHCTPYEYEYLYCCECEETEFIGTFTATTECIPCLDPSGLTASAISQTEIIFYAENANVLEYSYSGITWTTITGATFPYTLTGLTSCNEIMWRVYNDCSNLPSP